MKTVVSRSTRSGLPRVLAEMLRRLTESERLEFARIVDWREIEEWKATAETLEDKALMTRIRRGVKDESCGRLRKVDLG